MPPSSESGSPAATAAARRRLPRIVGLGRASEILLTGRFVNADEAERIGLVNRVVPAADLLHDARELAKQIARNSPFGVRLDQGRAPPERGCTVVGRGPGGREP